MLQLRPALYNMQVKRSRNEAYRIFKLWLQFAFVTVKLLSTSVCKCWRSLIAQGYPSGNRGMIGSLQFLRQCRAQVDCSKQHDVSCFTVVSNSGSIFLFGFFLQVAEKFMISDGQNALSRTMERAVIQSTVVGQVRPAPAHIAYGITYK